MYLRAFLAVLAIFALCPSSGGAQGLATQDPDRAAIPAGQAGSTFSSDRSAEQGQLSSASVARRFYELAYDLARAQDVKGPRLEQAIAFLTASTSLNSADQATRALLIELASRQPEPDRSGLVYDLLAGYADESADLEITEKAVDYLLGRLNSREEREKLLEQMMSTLASGNSVFRSTLATILGTLKAEKADSDAAEFYFLQAYKANRYNRLAFDRLAGVAPDQISPAVSLERLRLALRENPSDLDAAVAFAGRAEKLELYELGAAGYRYCADLFQYLYESQAVPARIYLPWAICNYNSKADQSKCLQIAKRVRQESGFDLRMEAIAGRAAIKMGNPALAQEIFQSAEQKFDQLLAPRTPAQDAAGSAASNASRSRQTYMEQFAWYYCFGRLSPDTAVNWAHQAFAVENTPVTSSLLAYALATQNQMEWAKPLITEDNHTQIADLTQAMIYLADSRTDEAVQSLNSAIAKDPGSFAAERARELLAEQGRKYIPPEDPNSVLASLEVAFGATLAPVFTPPEQMISVKLDTQDAMVQYGTEFAGTVIVTNNSSEPFVVSDDGLFKGYIRIDAEVSGDLTLKVPNLVFTRTRTTFVVAPGRSLLVPVRLFAGKLREMLTRHPQATLDVEFTAYIDPVAAEGGRTANRLTRVEPARARIRRPGVRLMAKTLRDQFRSISTSGPDQKVEIAQLFTGLLLEQQEVVGGRLPYRFMYADWVTPMLKNALSHEPGLLLSPAESDWVVKVHTMADMLGLSLDYEVTSAVAEDLNDPKWPVRMMAVYLLASDPAGTFDKVLDSISQRDPSRFVRDMATALSARSE